MAQTVEELEAQKAAKEQQVQEAAAAAGADAQAKGATPEEVAAAVEKARTEEKNKLYGQIEALKSGIEELRSAMREEKEEKERVKQEAERKAEAARQAKLSDTERQTEILRRLEEQLKNEADARKDFEQRLADRDRKDELNKYREALVKAGGDEIIPDLVVGNSKEELDTAFNNAKARYKEFAERFRDERGNLIRKGMPRSTNPDTGAQEELELDAELVGYDQDKYMKDPAYRAKITRELERAYKQASGRT